MECAVVCSAIEGNVDVVTHGETGLLFRAKDQSDLLEKLSYALEHPEEMKSYATTLRKKVEDQFDQAYVHACLKQKYLELLNDRTARHSDN